MALQIVAYRFPVAVQAAEVHFLGGLPGIQRLVHKLRQPVCLAVLQIPGVHQVLGIHTVILHLLVEGVPVGHIPAVREADHQNGQSGLPEEHILDERRIRLNVALGASSRRSPPRTRSSR